MVLVEMRDNCLKVCIDPRNLNKLADRTTNLRLLLEKKISLPLSNRVIYYHLSYNITFNLIAMNLKSSFTGSKLQMETDQKPMRYCF